MWQIQVKGILIQLGIHKALKGKPFPASSNDSGKSIIMINEDWKALDERTTNDIRTCLAKNVLTNVGKILSARELWERLGNLYQMNL